MQGSVGRKGLATLDDLVKSITEIPLDEAESRIRAIRLSRRTPKTPRKTKKKKIQTRKQTKAQTDRLLGRMTLEQKMKLLEELQDET